MTPCGRKVYLFDYAKKLPVVTAPQLCMVGCTTCATTCTQDAIRFPSAGYIRHLIKQRKVLRQVKDELAGNRAIYDVALKEVGLGMLRALQIHNGRVAFTLALTIPDCPLRD